MKNNSGGNREKMKKIWKKMNRGVALAIILLVGLIIFFIIDNAVFAQEKPMLNEWLEEFLEETAKVNLLPEQYRVPGAEIPDDVIEAKTKEAKDFVDKYFTEYKSQYVSNSRKQQIIWLTDVMHEENRRMGNVIEDISFSLVNISGIQKQATNAVRISFTVNMIISASPSIRFLNLTQPVRGFSYTHNSFTDEEIQNMSSEFSMNITLFKINGEWKIAESQQWGGFNSNHRVVVG